MLDLLTFSITLNVKPTGKGRPRFSRVSGRTYTPEKTANAEAEIRWLLQKENPPCYEGPVTVEIECVFLKPKSHPKKSSNFCIGRYDWDNLGKIVCDACNGILWRDDRQIVSGKVVKRYGASEHVVLRVKEASVEDVQPLQGHEVSVGVPPSGKVS